MNVLFMRPLCSAILLLLLLFTISSCKQAFPNLDSSKFKEVERLDESLPAYPGAVKLNDKMWTSKPRSAHVSYGYRSDAGYDDLKRFYTERLKQSGWQFIGERGLYNWGEEYGGRALDFRNGEYSLVIEYAGSKAKANGWDYAISVVWNSGGR
jgi:hypothetical protein